MPLEIDLGWRMGKCLLTEAWLWARDLISGKPTNDLVTCV